MNAHFGQGLSDTARIPGLLGGGGFSTLHEDFDGSFDDSFPACAFFFFLKWKSVRTPQFHFLGEDQSTVAQRAETTVTECSLTRCV